MPAKIICLLPWLFFWISAAQSAVLIDDAGQTLTFSQPPQRIVSLVPAATEILCALGSHQALAGRTYENTHFEGVADVPVVGGPRTPDYQRIDALQPDLLIVPLPELKAAQAARGKRAYPILAWDEGGSLAAAEARIDWLGDIMDKSAQAARLRQDSRELLETLARKADRLPETVRKRVMRLVGIHDRLFVPGSGTFQTELIAAAGGLPPRLGDEPLVPLTLAQWNEFNPQTVFACGRDKKTIETVLARPEWAKVEAGRPGRVLYFSCALTDRAAAHTGYFAAWLATGIYGDEYGRPEYLVHPQTVLGERTLDVDTPYVARARIVESRLQDFVHRTLLIDFKEPQSIVSTTDGPRQGVLTIGNAFSPPPVWNIHHRGGWEASRANLFRVLGLDDQRASLIFTGADMNNLAIESASHNDLKITALVTAGAESNALRSSRDTGSWIQHGTINIIVLSNRRLSPKGATQALITVTEAKTAALWDMDIRSSQTPRLNPATGTGTDDIIVVAGGEGQAIDYTGGHAKVGELIARTVHAAVQKALRKQNGKAVSRSVFERLSERDLDLHSLLTGPDRPDFKKFPAFQGRLEALLLAPQGQSFIQAAFSLDDARVMGQLDDLAGFELWARAVASEIAGRHVKKLENIVGGEEIPPALKIALNALGTGLKYRK